jgi:hypothetical protein
MRDVTRTFSFRSQKRAELLVPWLVWHMALPFLSLINFLWSCVTLFYGLPLLITKPAIIVAVFILLVNGEYQKSQK